MEKTAVFFKNHSEFFPLSHIRVGAGVSVEGAQDPDCTGESTAAPSRWAMTTGPSLPEVAWKELISMSPVIDSVSHMKAVP